MKTLHVHKTYMLFLWFFIGIATVFSQSSTLNWTADSHFLERNTVAVELTSNLSKQGDSFTWEQQSQNNSEVSSYNITAVSGSWDFSTDLGELHYTIVSVDDNQGTLTVTGNTEGITMVLQLFDASGQPDQSYTFYIETLTNS